MNKYSVIFAQQGKLAITENGLTDILIFPVGHSDVVVHGPDNQPWPISVDIDEEAFNRLRDNTLLIYKDFTKMWSDFSHTNATITSWLQDLVWDSTKGIIAKVKLTEAGLTAAKNCILNYFSPSFKIDNSTQEILSLTSCFGAMTDSPAFTELKEYPITAMDASNIYYKNLKRKQIMIEKEIKTEIVVEATKSCPAVEADGSEQETPEITAADKVAKAKKALVEAEAKVKKTEADAEAFTKKTAIDQEKAAAESVKEEAKYVKREEPAVEDESSNPDEVADVALFDSKFVELFTKYLPKIKELLGGDETGQAVKANNAIKSLEDKITAINEEQCKLTDALKTVTKEEKEKILRATAGIIQNNVDMPGVKAEEIIVRAEQAAGVKVNPDQLYKQAVSYSQKENCSFDKAWNHVRNEIK